MESALCAKLFRGMDIILPRTPTGHIAGIVAQFGPDSIEPTVQSVTKLLIRLGLPIDTGPKSTDISTLAIWTPSRNALASGIWILNLTLPYSKTKILMKGPNRKKVV